MLLPVQAQMGTSINLRDIWDIKGYLFEAILPTTFSHYMESLQ